MSVAPLRSGTDRIVDPACGTTLATILDLVPIPAAIIVQQARGAVLREANRAFVRAGLKPAAVLDAIEAGVGDCLAGGVAVSLEWAAGDAVEPRHYRVTLSPLPGDAAACLVSLIDQTGEITTEQNLRREMTIDSLTGLPNRTGFGDRLEAELSDDRRKFAVIVIDLDRFSRINACLGGMVGDELLITVARRVKSALRAGDVLARIGGDEFGILLAIEDDAAEADQVARRIRAALATPFRLSDFEIRVTCSIGIAIGREAAGQAEDVIRHAQFAMKRSKRSGVAESYQYEAFDVARERFAMETALRRAIDGGQLRLAFQPVCDLESGRVHAFEALARWTDESGRDHSPTEFIAVAEESGLIVPLGRWALDRAVETLAAWDRRWGGDCTVQVAVNLSPLQLGRETMADVVAETLARHGIDGPRLKLELTESALVDEPERIASVLHALKALGPTIAMDDFGTGYSNLATLQALPIDMLKIDRSFVTTMMDDRDKMAIVKAVLALAQALGMTTVAEGIETPDLARTLEAMGCTYGQGFHFARALSPDDAYALLESRNR